MPGFDKTGPKGDGPMTGRGLGKCGDGTRRGFGRGAGRGFGRGFFGRGLRRYKPEDEKEALKAELEEMQREKEVIEKRLKELD